ncbi:RNA-binding protein 41 isoform X2 [Hemicordylus capensis]|uniref:RNA-binding protein 41 isoform X2 n=1 Tax=Hemicordylus capensis TaxID=884348 RepID=UPI002303B1EB|nr:RNA-binding protein 41 isoform X2 [Hemicordylus capensis]
MRRVNSSLSGDDLLLEDLETEGERQLKSLLHHQLDTSVSIEQCVSKRRRFAPAAVYKPFGEEAAGTRTLPQFQALQESSKEAASLRELGLSDAEIHLWRNRAAAEKSSGLGAAPEALQDRIEAIQAKIAERQQILSLPQRFAGSKQLSRREMEIEKALFQGTDRHSFLRVLYHQDEAKQKAGHEKDPMAHLEAVYQEMLHPEVQGFCQPASHSTPGPSSSVAPSTPTADQSPPQPPPSGSLTVTEPVGFIPEEEIQRNRLSEGEIRQLPRFSSYHPGQPSEVLYLKNLSPRVTVKDLVSLFARYQEEDGPQVQFRLLSGRMRGQAFLTFPNLLPPCGDHGCIRRALLCWPRSRAFDYLYAEGKELLENFPVQATINLYEDSEESASDWEEEEEEEPEQRAGATPLPPGVSQVPLHEEPGPIRLNNTV